MIFDEKALARALNNIVPPDKSNAVVFGVNNDGIRVATHVVRKFNNVDWKIEGEYQHNWTGEDEVLGRIGFYW